MSFKIKNASKYLEASNIVGYTGFEPATSTSRTSRATSCANTRKIHTYKKSLPDWKALARVTGLEPVISGVTGQRDNQLRYTRVMFNNIYSSLILVNRSEHKFAKKIIFFYLCSPIIFSIQTIEYQRPNFLAQSLKVPTVAKPICW